MTYDEIFIPPSNPLGSSTYRFLHKWYIFKNIYSEITRYTNGISKEELKKTLDKVKESLINSHLDDLDKNLLIRALEFLLDIDGFTVYINEQLTVIKREAGEIDEI